MPLQIAAGFQTYQTVLGNGPRRILAIHCSLAHSGAWGPLAEQLEQVASITAFDMPGHGRSGDWDDRGDYQGVAAQIAATMLDEPMDVVGHSFGATVAMRLAVAHPEMVRSLTLIEPVLFAVVAQDNPHEFAAYRSQAKPFEQAMIDGNLATAAKLFTEHWGDGRSWGSLSQSNRDALTMRIPLVFATDPAIYRDEAGLLQPGALDALKIPCLLMRGSVSPSIVGLINAGLLRRLPGAQNVVVDGAGHMVPITHPAAVATALRDLFRRAP